MRQNEEQKSQWLFLHRRQRTYHKDHFHRQRRPIHSLLPVCCPGHHLVGILHASLLQPFPIEQGCVGWSPPLGRQAPLAVVKRRQHPDTIQRQLSQLYQVGIVHALCLQCFWNQKFLRLGICSQRLRQRVRRN
jgi:hypothetical protein